MTAPVEPVPTLELPSDRLMQWSQMAMLLASQLAGRREALERLAWSDAEHAARVHDLAERRDASAEPAVRTMTAQERALWPTTSDDVTGTTSPVTAEVASLGERWGLHATAPGEDETVREVWVSCREENTARALASEILHRGEPEAVHRLGTHLQIADQLATQRAHALPVDREAMATQVHAAWPPGAAAAVVRCPAWPTLAERLAAAKNDGHDLMALLGRMDTRGIPTARKPAALASWLLDRATETSTPPHSHELGVWVDQLDSASMIDRVGALSVVGYCGPTLDARLLSRFPDLLDDASQEAHTAAAAEGLAGDRERSAAIHQATVDDPTTPQREDLDGQDLAGGDLHDAAAARATAAEHHGAPDAAAARANVTLTAPGTATHRSAAAQTPPPPHTHPAQPTRLPPRRGR